MVEDYSKLLRFLDNVFIPYNETIDVYKESRRQIEYYPNAITAFTEVFWLWDYADNSSKEAYDFLVNVNSDCSAILLKEKWLNERFIYFLNRKTNEIFKICFIARDCKDCNFIKMTEVDDTENEIFKDYMEEITNTMVDFLEKRNSENEQFFKDHADVELLDKKLTELQMFTKVKLFLKEISV